MRIFAFIAFILGGILSVFVLLVLSGFGKSQAGMSAVSISGPSVDSLLPWIAGAYFFTSAACVSLARKRESLWLAAILSHLILLILYFAICSEEWGHDSGKFLSQIVMLAVIMLVFFSPWFVIWSLILARSKGGGSDNKGD